MENLSEAAKRLRAALFARVPLHAAREEAAPRLAVLRAAAQARGYDVALERVGDGPPWLAHEWVYEFIEAADAGSFHALFLGEASELGESAAEANWIRGRLERSGVWIIEVDTASPDGDLALKLARHA